MKVLITGAAGFIGHHLVERLLLRTDWELIIIDRLDTSGNLNRLAEIGALKNPRIKFVYHDLKAAINEQLSEQIGSIDIILHLGAGTHVDRSISHPMEFVFDNVVATCNILEFARSQKHLSKFLYFSTDEVFGPAPVGHAYKENDRYRSGNPYAATKAGGEELAVAYANTYGLPILITHTMNVMGTRQHPEKMVPLCISRARDGQIMKIHADKSRTKAGSRYYIDARDVAAAVEFLLNKVEGLPGEKFNIVGDKETDNLALGWMIARAQCKELRYEMVDFHSSRPGHDLRYALDGSKMARLGWQTAYTIEESVKNIVKWSLENDRWLLKKA